MLLLCTRVEAIERQICDSSKFILEVGKRRGLKKPLKYSTFPKSVQAKRRGQSVKPNKMETL